MGKLRVNQFYCVACRKKVSRGGDDIYFRNIKNKNRGSVPSLKSECAKCGTRLTKFVAVKKANSLKEKYGTKR